MLRTKKYDFLPLLGPRSGAPVLRSTNCFICFGLEMVPEQKVRFVAAALASKLCASATTNDFLALLWSRSLASMLRSAICCRRGAPVRRSRPKQRQQIVLKYFLAPKQRQQIVRLAPKATATNCTSGLAVSEKLLFDPSMSALHIVETEVPKCRIYDPPIG